MWIFCYFNITMVRNKKNVAICKFKIWIQIGLYQGLCSKSKTAKNLKFLLFEWNICYFPIVNTSVLHSVDIDSKGLHTDCEVGSYNCRFLIVRYQDVVLLTPTTPSLYQFDWILQSYILD